MALANVGVLLAKWGRKVLLVDWDLEAPGLEHFFKPFLDHSLTEEHLGLVDLLDFFRRPAADSTVEVARGAPIDISIPGVEGTLKIITAGRRDSEYFKKVRDLDVDGFYANDDGGAILEFLRDLWKSDFDFVLVDSRTGITDIGGICTVQLPDLLVLLPTTTEQSLAGIIDVAQKVSRARQEMPVDRLGLYCIPIPGKFDTITEYAEGQNWLDRFSKDLGPLYAEWLPTKVEKRKFVEMTKIPYVSFFSFGEKLAVLEPGANDPSGLGYAYETLAAIIANELLSIDQLVDNRSNFLQLAQKRPIRLTTGGSVSCVVLIELSNVSTIQELLATTTPVRREAVYRENVLQPFSRTVVEQAAIYAGESLSRTREGSIIGFESATNALRCALAIQERLAVNPIRTPIGALKAKICIYSGDGPTIAEQQTVPELPPGINLARIAAITLLALTRDGDVTLSESTRKQIPSHESVRFKSLGKVELQFPARQVMDEAFRAIGFRRVQLNRAEIELLFHQDPKSRSAGGFQAFLVNLQRRTDQSTGLLDLTISDREKIARYAFDYQNGGWQSRLVKIFGRILGNRLGREDLRQANKPA